MKLQQHCFKMEKTIANDILYLFFYRMHFITYITLISKFNKIGSRNSIDCILGSGKYHSFALHITHTVGSIALLTDNVAIVIIPNLHLPNFTHNSIELLHNYIIIYNLISYSPLFMVCMNMVS